MGLTAWMGPKAQAKYACDSVRDVLDVQCNLDLKSAVCSTPLKWVVVREGWPPNRFAGPVV